MLTLLDVLKIKRREFHGKVYNLEVESESHQDDLFWIEQGTGIVTHNCFPKDLSSFIEQISDKDFDPIMLKACWEHNKKLRSDLDWKDIPGAVSKKKEL